MPIRITFNDGHKIEFIYDATGKKWRKTAKEAGKADIVRDYIGEAEYLNTQQDIIHFSEGYAKRDISTDGDGVWNGWVYKYTLKDHLGNTRVTYCDKDKDGIVNTSTIEQVNHYYAFGLNIEGPWAGADGAFKYQYNGKEWNDDFGLGWNDYGFRMYDPAGGRWVGIDKFNESYKTTSPYAYVENNPSRYLDVNGLFKWPAEYYTKYPILTAYLQQNIQRDIMNSRTIMLGLSKHSGGNLNRQKILEATTWGQGPKIRVSDTPGDSKVFGKEPQGFYDRYGTKDIIINTRLAEQLEKASPEERQLALLSIYKTILHEFTHHGDYLDNEAMINSQGDELEAGNEFDKDVYFTGKNGVPNATFNDLTGISTIARAQEWKGWIGGQQSLNGWMQLIPHVPAQYRSSFVPVTPLPILKPQPINPPRA